MVVQKTFKNNIKKLKKLSVVALTLFCGTATGIAHASISQPVNNWEVSSIDSVSGKTSSYCVAANAFDDRTIMIIAYESGKQSSIAFNIRENKFKPREVYPVSLEFSNGSLGQFNALAENETTLILQAGSDPLLWQSLVNSASVKMRAKDLQREYSLKQFDFVYSSLNECVGDKSRAQDLKKSGNTAVNFSGEESKILQKHTSNTDLEPLDERFLVDAFAVEMPKGLAENKAPQTISSASRHVSSSPSSSVHPAVEYVHSLLKQSSISLKSSDASPLLEQDYFRYTWVTEQGLQGKFEQVYWTNEVSFYDLTKNYIERNGLSCGADFMPMTNEAYRVGDVAIADGQGFCMGQSDSVAVSYLFFGIGNTFSVIEHKGRFDQLETALFVRENIRQTLEFIAGGKLSQQQPSLLPSTLPSSL